MKGNLMGSTAREREGGDRRREGEEGEGIGGGRERERKGRGKGVGGGREKWALWEGRQVRQERTCPLPGVS